jgi:4-aminobutyrate aminotransferase
MGCVRGRGLMIGVEFVKDPETHKADEKLRDVVVDKAFERGLLLLGCGKSVIRVSPPLSITRAEIDEGLAIFEEAIDLAEKGK